MNYQIKMPDGDVMDVKIQANEWRIGNRDCIVAVLGDWDEGCKYEFGSNDRQAAQYLADMVDGELIVDGVQVEMPL